MREGTNLDINSIEAELGMTRFPQTTGVGLESSRVDLEVVQNEEDIPWYFSVCIVEKGIK